MNSLTIIGNLTAAPTTAATNTGKRVCNFTVAVNRRVAGQVTADFFRVTAWEQLGDNCAKYLDKGRKVCVRGPVTVRPFKTRDGQARAVMELTAQEVEFLTPANQQGEEPQFLPVDDGDLPF